MAIFPEADEIRTAGNISKVTGLYEQNLLALLHQLIPDVDSRLYIRPWDAGLTAVAVRTLTGEEYLKLLRGTYESIIAAQLDPANESDRQIIDLSIHAVTALWTHSIYDTPGWEDLSAHFVGLPEAQVEGNP